MSNIDFTDLDTDLSLQSKAQQTVSVDESVAKWSEKNASAQGAIYEESCKSCRGTGRFVSWSGRTVGSCFKCDGKGKLFFKTSPEQRAKGRDAAKAKKEEKAKGIVTQAEEFTAANPAEVEFIMANSSWSDFYRDMAANLSKYGSLTDRQLEAIRNGMAKAAAREEAKAKKQADAPVVSAIIEAFAKASSSGLKRPKLELFDLSLSLAPATGKNAGCVYVKHQGEYVGKVLPSGKFLPINSCPQTALDLVAKLSENVLEQAVMYGKQTGICCCCGRQLENAESVELGIGPICRGRWGL